MLLDLFRLLFRRRAAVRPRVLPTISVSATAYDNIPVSRTAYETVPVSATVYDTIEVS